MTTRICTLATETDRAGQYCACEVCGAVARCTESNDYYARPGHDGLTCERCMRRSLASRGIEALILTVNLPPSEGGTS